MHPILSHLGDLRPRLASFLILVLHWPLPCVLWSSSLYIPCRVPAQFVSCYIRGWSVYWRCALSIVIPSSYGVLHRFLLWPSPEFFVTLVTLSTHWIPSIDLRHLLMNVWTLVIVCLFVHHVSEPYSRIDLTFEFKSCSIVWNLKFLDFEIFFVLCSLFVGTRDYQQVQVVPFCTAFRCRALRLIFFHASSSSFSAPTSWELRSL